MTFIERRQEQLIIELRNELVEIKGKLKSTLAHKVELEQKLHETCQRLHYGKPGT